MARTGNKKQSAKPAADKMRFEETRKDAPWEKAILTSIILEKVKCMLKRIQLKPVVTEIKKVCKRLVDLHKILRWPGDSRIPEARRVARLKEIAPAKSWDSMDKDNKAGFIFGDRVWLNWDYLWAGTRRNMASDLKGVCGYVVHHTKDFVWRVSEPYFSQVGGEIK